MDFSIYQQFFQTSQFQLVLKIITTTAPIWITAFLGFWLWGMWLTYRRALYFASISTVLLEIKLPKEIFKSPKAMEFFFGALFQTGGEGNWYDVYWKGQTRPWFSCEICSIDGKLRFFVWTQKKFKDLIEANLYSQYPGIEIHEVEDYSLPIAYNPETQGAFSAEFELTKSDPFPLKTYVDYGMDKDPKEEFKIDPMTPLVEFMASSMSTGHTACIQIILRAHKSEDWDPVKKELVDNRWSKGAGKEIESIREKTKTKEEGAQPRRLTEVEMETITALERSVTKPGFDVGIRAIYVAPKDIFSAAVGAGITAGMRNYNSGNLNGFKPTRNPDAKYSFPWQDRKKKKRNILKKKMIDAYKHRGYFYNEFKSPYFVLNTEELATIFHLPGGVAITPAFDRIGSKKSEAPSNLPL
ncbi:MAG: hypothetical protein ACYCZW_01010 [Minisyncoccota bacterium]